MESSWSTEHFRPISGGYLLAHYYLIDEWEGCHVGSQPGGNFMEVRRLMEVYEKPGVETRVTSVKS